MSNSAINNTLEPLSTNELKETIADMSLAEVLCLCARNLSSFGLALEKHCNSHPHKDETAQKIKVITAQRVQTATWYISKEVLRACTLIDGAGKSEVIMYADSIQGINNIEGWLSDCETATLDERFEKLKFTEAQNAVVLCRQILTLIKDVLHGQNTSQLDVLKRAIDAICVDIAHRIDHLFLNEEAKYSLVRARDVSILQKAYSTELTGSSVLVHPVLFVTKHDKEQGVHEAVLQYTSHSKQLSPTRPYRNPIRWVGEHVAPTAATRLLIPNATHRAEQILSMLNTHCDIGTLTTEELQMLALAPDFDDGRYNAAYNFVFLASLRLKARSELRRRNVEPLFADECKMCGYDECIAHMATESCVHCGEKA